MKKILTFISLFTLLAFMSNCNLAPNQSNSSSSTANQNSVSSSSDNGTLTPAENWNASEACATALNSLAMTDGLGTVPGTLQDELNSKCYVTIYRDECLTALYNWVSETNAASLSQLKTQFDNYHCRFDPDSTEYSSSSTSDSSNASSSSNTSSSSVAIAPPSIPQNCNELDETAQFNSSSNHKYCPDFLYDSQEENGWSKKTYTNPAGQMCTQHCIEQYDLPAGPDKAWYQILCVSCQ